MIQVISSDSTGATVLASGSTGTSTVPTGIQYCTQNWEVVKAGAVTL
jgi:hypothetical protein